MSDKITFGNVFQSWFGGASANSSSPSSNSTNSRVNGAFSRKNTTNGPDRNLQPVTAPALSKEEITNRTQSLNAAIDFLRTRVKEGEELNFRVPGNRQLINSWLTNPPLEFKNEPETTVIAVCSYVNRLMRFDGCISMFDPNKFTAKEWLAINTKVLENDAQFLHFPGQNREEIKNSQEFKDLINDLRKFVNQDPNQNLAITNFISILHNKYKTAIKNETYFNLKEHANYEAIRASSPACFHGQIKGAPTDLQHLPLNHSLVQFIIENADEIFDFSSLDRVPEKKEAAEESPRNTSSETHIANSSSPEDSSPSALDTRPSDYRFDEEENAPEQGYLGIFKTTLESSLKERPGVFGFRSGLLNLIKDDYVQGTNASSSDYEGRQNSAPSDNDNEWGNFGPQETPKPDTTLKLPRENKVHQRMQVTSLRPAAPTDDLTDDSPEAITTGPSIDSLSQGSIQELYASRNRIHMLENQLHRFQQEKKQFENSQNPADKKQITFLEKMINHMEETTLKQACNDYKNQKAKLGAAARVIDDERNKLIDKHERDQALAYLDPLKGYSHDATTSISNDVDFEFEALKSIARQL